jgi:hypothetical protein
LTPRGAAATVSAMALYVCESYDHAVDHGGRSSQGVLGEPLSPQIKEKIYLHVLPLSDDDVKRLGARRDDDGNAQHGRLCLPGDDAFWVAVEGEVAYPKVFRPRVVSKCADGPKGPVPVPLAADELERMRKAGVSGLP